MLTIMVVLALVGGSAAVVSADVAAAVGLPRAAPGGTPWNFRRAGQPHSLASQLARSTDGQSLRDKAEANEALRNDMASTSDGFRLE